MHNTTPQQEQMPFIPWWKHLQLLKYKDFLKSSSIYTLCFSSEIDILIETNSIPAEATSIEPFSVNALQTLTYWPYVNLNTFQTKPTLDYIIIREVQLLELSGNPRSQKIFYILIRMLWASWRNS